MQPTLYPNADANARLLEWLIATLGGLREVQQIWAFGSFARQQADRWSDIDLLVVTSDRSQFGAVFAALAAHKSVIYRSTFTPQVEPSGGRILGIVFASESVFHSLDLNFMTTAEFAAEAALQRFGMMQAQPVAPTARMDVLHPNRLTEDFEPADEKRVADALHFVKKTLKRRLRGTGSDEDLVRWLTFLQEALEHYRPPTDNPRGDIASVARVYADMANIWLGSRQ